MSSTNAAISRQRPPLRWVRLGELHRLSSSVLGKCSSLTELLPREPPWVFGFRRPEISWLADLTAAHAELLQILQTDVTFAARFDQLAKCWRTEALIHGDVRFDNTLIQVTELGDVSSIKLWIVDWEMVQIGDPAWDVAGALQDFLVHWVATMPASGELSAEDRMTQARWPLASLRCVTPHILVRIPARVRPRGSRGERIAFSGRHVLGREVDPVGVRGRRWG